jgi:hypothetical protein
VRRIATEPSCAAPQRELHGLLADLARLALVDIADAADEAALQVAEGVAAHALDAELALDLFAQQVGQRAGAGELHVAVRVALQFVLASARSIGVPLASWMPSLTATTQRPWRACMAFTSARKCSMSKVRSGR